MKLNFTNEADIGFFGVECSLFVLLLIVIAIGARQFGPLVLLLYIPVFFCALMFKGMFL